MVFQSTERIQASPARVAWHSSFSIEAQFSAAATLEANLPVTCPKRLKCSYTCHPNHGTTMRMRFPVTKNHQPMVSAGVTIADAKDPTTLQWFLNQLHIPKQAQLELLCTLVST
jgi:hypothetical protein